MSRKYCTKHPERGRNSEEGTSGYQKRLRDRGLGKAPHMLALDTLRVRQARRVRETCTLDHEHDPDFSHRGHCNGYPWPTSSELGEAEEVKVVVEAEPTRRERAPHVGTPRTPRPGSEANYARARRV